jgi:alpha-maltose-1-phosphate synthase
MKVAIVRGSNLNPYEMQSYELLMCKYDLTGFSSFRNKYETDTIRFPTKKLHISEELYERLPWPARSIAWGALLPHGMNEYMLGLEEQLECMDILHATETCNGYSYQAARVRNARKKKLVLTVWENIPFRSVKSFKGIWSNEKIVDYVRNSTDIFIAVTDRARIALQIEGVSNDRIRIIPAGIDTERFRPGVPESNIYERLKASDEDFNLLFIGRLTREKGIYDLLYAAKLLSLDLETKHVKILLAGGGPEEGKLKQKSQKLGLSESFRFLGNFTYKEIPGLYRAVDAFILPSIPVEWWQEQFGMVLVEAMASGLPVISTLSGSIPEVIGDAGILIQPGDPLSIYNAVRKISLDAAYRQNLSEMARRRAVDLFDINHVKEKIKKVYDELA